MSIDFTNPTTTQNGLSPSDIEKMDATLAAIQQNEKKTKTTTQKVGDVLSGWGTTPALAVGGAGIGLLGGPAAPLTVPLGAFAGASVGKLLQRLGSYMNGTSDPNEGGIKSGISAGMNTAVTGAGYATTAAILQNLPTILSWLTHAGPSKLTNKLTQQATEQGNETPLLGGEKGVLDKFLSDVNNKFGAEDTVAGNATNKLLMNKSPVGGLDQYRSFNNAFSEAPTQALPDELMLNPQQALDRRQQVAAGYPAKNMFSNLLNLFSPPPSVQQNTEQGVAGILRNNYSQALHEMAPGTVLPDKINSLYYKFGTPLSWVGKIGVPVGLAELLKHLLPGGGTPPPPSGE